MTLLAKVRQILAPAIEVEREIGHGGMGVVFLGRDTTLDRPVAIKVLRPEFATAIATERFLQEARVLARLKHPNAVQVYQAATVEGLLYYVMDLVEGETLAARLERGPLSEREAVSLGRDLLDVLAASHRLGIVHRDIKPGNIFLEHGRARLGDFGIAHVSEALDTEERLTLEGELLGTPAYMAPEQLAREQATESTDLYSLSLVLYECTTGRRWTPLKAPEDGYWGGLSSRLASVIRRGLAYSPSDRWPTATAYRDALATRPKALIYGGLVGGLVVAGAAAMLWLGPWRETLAPAVPALVIGEFAVATPDDRGAADQLVALLAASLGGLTDVQVRQGINARPNELMVRGTFAHEGERIRLTSFLRSGDGATEPLYGSTVSSVTDAVDSLANTILLRLWQLNEWWVPAGALPTRPGGLAALGRAELLYAGGRFEAAAQAYRAAARLDSTCLLCWFRYNDVRRWLDREIDADGQARVLAGLSRFPTHYQLLIRAEAAPFPERLELLRQLVEDYPGFAEGWRRLGGELHNRGPLYGHDPAEAGRRLETAVRLNPLFIPPWYDLAVVLTAQGDSVAADSAAKRFLSAPHDLGSLARAVLLDVAFRFRFYTDSAAGLEPWHQVRADPRIFTLPELPAGPRILEGMGTPFGGILLGRDYADSAPRSTLHTSGLIAQIFGYAATGRFALMRETADTLRMTFPEMGADPFQDRLWALHAIFDDAGPSSERLSAWAAAELKTSPPKSAWLVGLQTLRSGRSLDAGFERVLSNEAAPARRLIEAWKEAAAGRYATALQLTREMGTDPAILEGEAGGDLFLRAALKLSRAEWFTHEGDLEAARRELRWHRHFHMTRYPVAGPEVPEVDWALSALASWKLATLIDRRDAEVCGAYATVAERWAVGDPPYAERAAAARVRFEALECEAAR